MNRQLTCSCAGPSPLSQAPRFDRQHRSLLTNVWRSRTVARRHAVLVKAVEGPAEVAKAAGKGVADLAKAAGQLVGEIVDDNVLDYCSLDDKGARAQKTSLGEKEQQFLSALASFYYDDQPMMSNEEFDNLKEELIWEGSTVAVLSPAEQRFMEASTAYTSGKGYLTDDDYDNLKKQLQEQNSRVVLQGPRCSLRSRTMYSDCSPDYIKISALNLPAVILLSLGIFALDHYTSVKASQLLELPQPWNLISVWGAAVPAVYLVAAAITNLVLKDGLILKGQCPNCGHENSTYFGDILTVRGSRDKNTVQCESCKSEMTFLAAKRQIIIQQNPDDQSGKTAKAKAEQEAQPQPA